MEAKIDKIEDVENDVRSRREVDERGLRPPLAGVLDKIDEFALSQADVRRRPRGAPDRGRVEVSGVTATQPPRGDCDSGARRSLIMVKDNTS